MDDRKLPVNMYRRPGRERRKKWRIRFPEQNCCRAGAPWRDYKCFFLPETKDRFDFTQYSYVIDAVDTVTARIRLVLMAQEAGTPVVSSMGAGNKLDPTQFVAFVPSVAGLILAGVVIHDLIKV